MKTYHLLHKQFLPVSRAEAWRFFAAPGNLIHITPAGMNMRVLYQSGGDSMYAGQIIRYKITVLPFIAVDWVTEITHVEEPFYFIDEQRTGPYALWHHEHRFYEVPGGVDMVDEISYAIPLGIIGRLANTLFVRRKLNAIFNYRFRVLEAHFNNIDRTLEKTA